MVDCEAGLVIDEPFRGKRERDLPPLSQEKKK